MRSCLQHGDSLATDLSGWHGQQWIVGNKQAHVMLSKRSDGQLAASSHHLPMPIFQGQNSHSTNLFHPVLCIHCGLARNLYEVGVPNAIVPRTTAGIGHAAIPRDGGWWAGIRLQVPLYPLPRHIRTVFALALLNMLGSNYSFYNKSLLSRSPLGRTPPPTSAPVPY